MTAVTRPRGPLPRRVYWFRRLLVLAVALALVVGIARLLGAGGSEPADQATPVAGEATATRSEGAPAEDDAARQQARQERREERRRERRHERKALPQPDGPCLAGDIVVTPLIRTQPAGQRVRVVLQVGTLESAACTWEVSPESVFVNISDEDLGLLWTTQQCTSAVPTREVVARKEKPARVAFGWDGRESDEGCTGTGSWVTSGSYVVAAAARGSTQLEDAVFVLGPAEAPTITATPTPTAEPSGSTGTERPGSRGNGDRDGREPAARDGRKPGDRDAAEQPDRR